MRLPREIGWILRSSSAVFIKSEIAEFPSIVILSAAKDRSEFPQTIECDNIAVLHRFWMEVFVEFRTL